STAAPPAWACSASSTAAATSRSSTCGITSVNLVNEVLDNGVSHATRNDRTRADGRQHGSATSQGGPPLRGLRQVAQGGRGAGPGEGGGRRLARGPREEARHAAGGVADGPGGRRGPDHRRPRPLTRGG